tara:strand:+ start:4933 stop:6186 length:1254 start_codon:yes stop_codon:yes gene_type:complete
MINVLWITNFPLADACVALGNKPHKGGGWMNGLAEQLRKREDISLCVLSFFDEDEEKRILVNGISYILLPRNLVHNEIKLNNTFIRINEENSSNLVHIHGTEYNYGMKFIEACPETKSLVSLQGLVGVYARYFTADIGLFEILRNTKLLELWNSISIHQQQKSFVQRGLKEKLYLQKADMVVGRTSWDYVHTIANNRGAVYRFCNEMLRKPFYSAVKWNISNINQHTIFISQAGYPIKGFHKLLEAVSLLVEEFPNIQVRVAGESYLRKPTFLDKLNITGSGYGTLIYKLIKKHKLNVNFLGILGEKEMVAEFQKAHLFVCPSSIENSPNSLGEAQIIGTPVIASYVGGVPDMVSHGKSGFLYRFEEIEMLAHFIREIFNDNSLACQLSTNGIDSAEKRHSRDTIITSLLQLYNELL